MNWQAASSGSFSWPTELRFGAGRFLEAAQVAARFGSRALLVTGRSAMNEFGYAPQLEAALMRHRIVVRSFRVTHPSPTIEDVDCGAALARDQEVELIIGLGGGSALDAAKLIAAVTASSRPAADFLNQRVQPSTRTLPVIAIPTTAGTGTELNRSAMLTNPQQRYKGAVRSDYLYPRIAVVDPRLTHTTSRSVTAQAGFDVLAHAIESYVSPKAQPWTDGLALRAISAVVEFLPIALDEPANACAREPLASASTTMGINLSLVGTCLPHRLDKPLCAAHPEIPHGQSVALFYASWLRRSYRGNVQRFAEVAERIEPELRGESVIARAEACSGVLERFLDRLGLNRSFADFGVGPWEIPALVGKVEGDLSIDPVPATKSELVALFQGTCTPSHNQVKYECHKPPQTLQSTR